MVSYDVQDSGLVLEGGGLRGLYTIGVLDFFCKKNLEFKKVFGVSAGASNACSFLSGQIGRSKRINLSYIRDPRYLSWKRQFLKGSIFDMEFLFRKIPNELDVFDYEKFYASRQKLVVGVTNCLTGKADFFEANDLKPDDLMDLLIASCSIPFMAPIKEFRGNKYLDGGVAAAIALEQALAMGSKKNIIVLTRHQGYQKKDLGIVGKILLKYKYAKYPQFCKALLERASKYNTSLQMIAELEEKGSVFVIRPRQKLPGNRLERFPKILAQMYDMGYADAKNVYDDLLEWLGE